MTVRCAKVAARPYVVLYDFPDVATGAAFVAHEFPIGKTAGRSQRGMQSGIEVEDPGVMHAYVVGVLRAVWDTSEQNAA